MEHMTDQHDSSGAVDSACRPPRRRQVAVVYHFFPHYRAGVMKALQQDPSCEYIFVGDRTDPEGAIKACDSTRFNFLYAPCVMAFGLVLWQRGILRLAWSNQIDVMIFLGNANFLSTWLAAAVARIRGKRVLFWTHGWISDERGAKAFFRTCFYSLADGLLLYGRRAKSIAIRHGFSPSRLYVIFNSLDYEVQQAIREGVSEARLKQVRKDLFLNDSDAPLLICTSRLTALRGLELVLEAMRSLRDRGCPSNLLLVGDGPERAKLQDQAERLGVPVHFYGACYDEQRLAELIMASNVTVAPGQVGLTAMHSLAYGTPVLTHGDADHQMPEWEAIVPGATGAHFRRGDAEDLARVLGEWCAHPWPDPVLRRRCIDVVDRFYNPQYQAQVIGRAVTGQPSEPDEFDERMPLHVMSHAVSGK